ncbi:MAG: DUF1624 domain-containing protein [Saprospiraceae bacterium]|nr:DUF1624 domain-containing protein [Saprospiraceae bacterium]
MKRSTSIDFVRGLVMIVMALDHVRDLIHITATTEDPTNLTTTTPALFFTRWITHLCAPTFVFLAGTSAFLSLKSKNNLKESRRFLFTRGVWLFILNFTIVNFGIFMDYRFGFLFSQVIAAIGMGFIGLSLLMGLSMRSLSILSLVIIFGHDVFQSVSFPQGSPSNVAWSLLMSVGFFPISDHINFLTSYPYIPWLGIMLAGFCCGELFLLPTEGRKKWLLRLGLGSLAVFIALRTFNIYGDPAPWGFQKDAVFSFLSFINTSKYPPSLLYTSMTLGIMFLLFYVFEGVQNAFIEVISVYGRVPLFYYIVHWFVIHAMSATVFLAQGFSFSDLQFSGFGMGRPKEMSGLNLLGTYGAWLSIVVLLYPLCKWYSDYKLRHKDKAWLRYL